MLEIAGAWTLAFLVMGYLDYRGFVTRRFDLGNMVQAIWSTAHGRPLEVTEAGGDQITRLAVHVDPLLALFAPLWVVWPSPLMLIWIQVLAIATGALPVFWLARKHLRSERAALYLVGAYVLCPALGWQALNDVHPTTMAIPLVLFAIWFLDEEKLWWFAGTAVLLILSQEHIGVLVAGLGIWHAVTRRRWFFGGAVALIGIAWSTFAFGVLIPHFGGAPSPYYGRYADVGGSPLDILKTIVTDPVRVMAAVATVRDVLYLIALLLPFAGLFVLSPGLMLAGSPQLGMTLLSKRPSDLIIGGPVTALIIPFLMGATILGVAKLRNADLGARVVLAAAAVGAFMVGPLPSVATPAVMLAAAVAIVSFTITRSRVRVLAGVTILAWALLLNSSDFARFFQARLVARQFEPHVSAATEAIRMIPSNAPVSATNRIGSHLSARRYIYSFPLQERAEWIVVDTTDTWIHLATVRVRARPGFRVPVVEGFQRPNVMAAEISALRADAKWKVVFERAHVLVFRKVTPPSVASGA